MGGLLGGQRVCCPPPLLKLLGGAWAPTPPLPRPMQCLITLMYTDEGGIKQLYYGVSTINTGDTFTPLSTALGLFPCGRGQIMVLYTALL